MKNVKRYVFAYEYEREDRYGQTWTRSCIVSAEVGVSDDGEKYEFGDIRVNAKDDLEPLERDEAREIAQSLYERDEKLAQPGAVAA